MPKQITLRVRIVGPTLTEPSTLCAHDLGMRSVVKKTAYSKMYVQTSFKFVEFDGYSICKKEEIYYRKV